MMTFLGKARGNAFIENYISINVQGILSGVVLMQSQIKHNAEYSNTGEMWGVYFP